MVASLKDAPERVCRNCHEKFPNTEDYFPYAGSDYRDGTRKLSSYCRQCIPEVNARYQGRARKLAAEVRELSRETEPRGKSRMMVIVDETLGVVQQVEIVVKSETSLERWANLGAHTRKRIAKDMPIVAIRSKKGARR